MENNKKHEVFRACLRHCSGMVRVSGMFLNSLLPPFASALTPFAPSFFSQKRPVWAFYPLCNSFASSAKIPFAPLRTPLTLLSESPLPSTASLSTLFEQHSRHSYFSDKSMLFLNKIFRQNKNFWKNTRKHAREGVQRKEKWSGDKPCGEGFFAKFSDKKTRKNKNLKKEVDFKKCLMYIRKRNRKPKQRDGKRRFYTAKEEKNKKLDFQKCRW